MKNLKQTICILILLLFTTNVTNAQVTVTDLTPTGCSQRTLQLAYYGGNGNVTRAETIQIDYYNNSNCNTSSGGTGYAWQTYSIPNWQTTGAGLTYWTFTAPNNGYYVVTVFYTFLPGSGSSGTSSSPQGGFCLSNLQKPPVANGIINDGATVQCINNAITLTNTSTNAPTSYRISGFSTATSCGTQTTGSGSWFTPVGTWKTGNPSTINLKTELSPLFSSYTGWNKVLLEIQNSCGTSSKTFCFQTVNQTVPTGSFQFSICSGSGVATPSTNYASPTLTSSNGSGSIVNTSTTGTVDAYSYQIERRNWFCFPIGNPCAFFTIAQSGWITGTPPVSKSFNGIVTSYGTPPSNGYFNNANTCTFCTYRITFSVKNACGTASSVGYFQPNDAACKTDGQEEATAINEPTVNALHFVLYPNPTSNNLTVEFDIVKTENISLSLYDIKGSLVKEVLKNEIAGSGHYQKSFSVADLPAGTYFYHLQSDKAIKGAFVKD